jgi:hypothetical protein
MSSRVIDNKPFLYLILNSSSAKQKKALLQTITPEQIDVVSEFVHNLLHTLPLTTEEIKLVKRKKFLKSIDSLKRSQTYRGKKIVKHKLPILKLFESFRDRLLKLLSSM